MPFPLTEEQRRAVEERGGALLVSAAAGSGKTRVLVERLLDRVSRGADIDRFLIITYTKAAAAELRGRIAQELNERLAAQPGDRHLRRQTTLLYRAQISTVHAFCAQLLRENAAALDMDPDFRLCDEGEAAVLMDQALGRVLERRYEQMQPEDGFFRLVDTMSAGRDDRKLMQIVLDVFGRIQSHPDPDGWLDSQEQVWELEGVTDVAQTPWGAALMEDARMQAEHCARRLTQALELAGQDSVLYANYGPSLDESRQGIQALLRADRWDEMSAGLPVTFPRVGTKRGVVDLVGAERVKNLRARVKKQLDKLAERFEQSSEQQLYDLEQAAPAVKALVSLVRDFAAEYEQEKRHRGVVDFSDLEHMAVRLLYDSDSGQYTDLARSWSARFDEVMVDEFQDTNQVQNAIFRAVSDGGRNEFAVGDVKQSIYRFRLADPTIFLQRYETFKLWDEAVEGEPRKVLLKRNFRSRPQVLEGVNDLFRDLMSRQFGEMDYTDDQALVPGAVFPEDGDHRVELDVVTVEDRGEEEGEQEDKNLQEARNAALRIRQMLDEGLAVGERKLKASDVMILLRSPGPVLHHYVRALSEQNIPWSADVGEDFFATTEVNMALALLQIVDNPRQDVPIISALRSPVYAFSADRLAQLRAQAKGDFYTAVEEAARRGEQDCADFLEELDRLRFGAGERTCSQLVWHIYEQTNLLGLASAMPGGEERRAHLLALYELARQQEGAGCRTLFEFLLRLERLRANGHKFGSGPARQQEGVRIMSIHRSKGLEAPVVFVCGLGRRFNREDTMRPVLFHSRLGIGPKYLERERRIELNTLARRAVALTLEREMLAEELRLLYVAMTRAREKLVLTMALPRAERVLSGLVEDADSPVAPQVLMDCPSAGQWILLSVLNRRCGQPLRELAGLSGAAELDYTIPWDVRLVDGAQLEQGRWRAADKTDKAEDGLDPEWLARNFAWCYGHLDALDIPSKITATQSKGRSLDQEAAQEAGQTAYTSGAPLSRPRFAAEKLGLTPAQRGSALHLVMQYLDFDRTGTKEEIAAQIRELVDREYIDELQGEAAEPERLAAFFQSELGREVAAANPHREFKFSMLVDAGDYYPGVAGEELLLQGVVDCWFETKDGVTVLDFKSDRVTGTDVEQRVEDYRPQVEAYARALTELTGKPVTRRLLWFFALDRAVEV